MEREPRLGSALEEQVVTRVREGRDELVGILADLIAFDTTARLPGDPARDETACQEYLRDLLAPADGGASQCEADLWEPEPVGLQHPLLPHGLAGC